MLTFIIRRLLYSVALLLALSLITYLLFAALPTDPAALTCGKNCKPELIEANRVRLGYDKPVMEQYGLFLKGIFTGRDYGAGQASFSCPAPSLGYSFNQKDCVTTLIARAFPVTMWLALGAFVLWMVIGVGLGWLAAVKRGKWQDRFATTFAVIGLSLPSFYVGLLVLFTFVVWLQLLPFPSYTSPFDDPVQFVQAMILPWATMAVLWASTYVRITRNGMLDVMNEEFVRLGIAKGLSRRTVTRRYVLRAALVPIVTIAGLDLGALLGGAVFAESIFSLPGLGRLTLRSVNDSDLPVLLGTTLVSAALIVVATLVVDVLYSVLDPRVRVA